MKVSEIMSSPVKTVKTDCTLEDAALFMLEYNIGGVPVVDTDGKLVGILTESDFAAKEHAIPFSRVYAPKLFGEWMSKEGVEKAYEAARNITVDKIMSSPVACVSKDSSIADVIRTMLDKRVHRVLVSEENFPIGIVTRRDLLKLVVKDL